MAVIALDQSNYVCQAPGDGNQEKQTSEISEVPNITGRID
jgi:hypothetical protein